MDDDPLSRASLEALCSKVSGVDLDIFSVPDIQNCLEEIRKKRIDVLLLDKNLKNSNGKKINSLNFLPLLLNQQLNLQILMITGDHNSQDIVQAIKQGAFGFVSKGDSPEIILCQIEKALEVSRLALSTLYKTQEADSTPPFLYGKSEKIQKVLNMAHAFCQGQKPILILGETGTGKTILANTIHQQIEKIHGFGSRPFVSLNLSSLPTSLMERELFGNEKGAFTDAKERKRGYFELAHNGTLFLDEIAEIHTDLQIKLLKIIEEKTFYRLGSDKPIFSNFKLICATHRNLKEMVKTGQFREDLYMRISTLQLTIPPLRERKEDIPHLIASGLPLWAKENSVQICFEELPQSLLNFLITTPLPGNLRGIEQIISRLLVLSPRKVGGSVDLSKWQETLDLNKWVPAFDPVEETVPPMLDLNTFLKNSIPFNNVEFPGINFILNDLERQIYEVLSQKCSSNNELAALLKVSPANISLKLKTYGLKRLNNKKRSF